MTSQDAEEVGRIFVARHIQPSESSLETSKLVLATLTRAELCGAINKRIEEKGWNVNPQYQTSGHGGNERSPYLGRD